MNNQPINDSRLTPDLQLTRSGSTMQFRAAGKKTFDADFSIEAPSREYKAALVDGIWVWVNDCAECNGLEPRWVYFKCEKHEVCDDCKTPRKELKETPWGTVRGFRCTPCQDLLDKAARVSALSAMADKEYDEWDYRHTDEVVCPHCETKFKPDEPMEGKHACSVCQGEYTVQTEYTVSYSTEIVGERVTLDDEAEV